jgi:enterochelin esterase family protein
VTYPGAVFEGEVPVWVFLPPCYARGDRRYPVLIALHGYPYDESHWADLGLLTAAEAGLAAGELQPMIIVLPRQPEPLYRSTSGGPRSYEEELLEGLLPFVDSTYRTEARPESRTLAGISRGGVWSLEIGLRHPEVFASVAGLSPALSLNAARGGRYDPLVIAQQAEFLPARVYLMAGQEDWARASTEELDALLRLRGLALILDVRPGSHADSTWEPVMADVLRFAAPSVAP